MDAIDALERLSKALQNPAKLKAACGMAAGMIRGHIHEGRGWRPLAPVTRKDRDGGGGGKAKPLEDTGGLRDSITCKVIDGRTVVVGTNKPYARLQNSGGVIRAKKNWLWIPGPKVRPLQRKYGYSPTDVLKGLKAGGFSIFRMGRTMRYWKKGKKPPKDPRDYPAAYYLKKSAEVPARPFFYLTPEETEMIAEEAGLELKLEQL